MKGTDVRAIASRPPPAPATACAMLSPCWTADVAATPTSLRGAGESGDGGILGGKHQHVTKRGIQGTFYPVRSGGMACDLVIRPRLLSFSLFLHCEYITSKYV